MLAEAAEVEHNLLCSYLYAAFSLRGKHEGLTAPEAETVARWRQLVVGVAVQEMGHLATVNNLMWPLAARRTSIAPISRYRRAITRRRLSCG